MKRSELEHLIRASGEIADDDEIIIIGSQAILGQFPDAPAGLLVSMEADLYPRKNPANADKVDGAIGEGSSFHELHGYYAQGVSEKTAILPRGWESRLVPVNNENTNGITGYCLEVHDLAISKIIAGRTKDLDFVHELIRHKMVQKTVLLSRLEQVEISEYKLSFMRKRTRALFAR